MALKRGASVPPRPRTRLAVLAPLAALLVLALVLASRADAFVYWTNPAFNQDSIGRANLNGTGIERRFIPVSTAGGYPSDLALDAEHIYWAASCFQDPAATPPCASGAIGRANLDGTRVDQDLISGIDPGSVAVDAAHIYWTWSDCAVGWGVGGSLCTADQLQAGPPGGIARANLDGTGVDRHLISGIDAGSVAVNAHHIYWTGNVCEPGCGETIAPTIGRANLDGTGVDRNFVGVLPSGASGAWLKDLAIDAAHIYWTGQLFAYDGIQHGPALGRANLDGSGVDGAFIGGQLGPFHLPSWTGVAVDDAHIYWSEYDSGEESIVRANLDSSSIEHFIGAGSDKHFSPGALAVDPLADTKLAGRASAARTQRQTGKRIVVKVRVKAKERLTAKASGKIKVNPTYKLKPKTAQLAAGKTKTLKLKPKNPNARKFARALKRGDTAKAKLKVKLIDLAGNSEAERLRVRLKR